MSAAEDPVERLAEEVSQLRKQLHIKDMENLRLQKEISKLNEEVLLALPPNFERRSDKYIDRKY